MAAGTQPDSRPSATPPNAAPRTNTTSARLSSNAPCRVALPSRRASGPSSRSLAAPTVQSSRGIHAPPGRSTEHASASGNPTPAATRARVSASAARDTAGPPRDGSALRSLRDLDRAARAVTPQQHVERSRPAVAGPGGREGQYDARRTPPGEPALQPFFQHRRLVFRVEAAPVNDQDAAKPGADAVREKPVHHRARLLGRQSVQVDVRLPGEIPTPQPPHEPRIETDDGAFDVLARVGDVESRRAGDEVREQHQRLG